MALAAGYLAAAAALPAALPLVVATAAAACCALVLARRRGRRLRWTLVAILIWLALGFTGTLLVSGELLAGPAWVVAALFLLPLPLIPWAYARTFEEER
jgi:hypothetical protein